MIRGPMGGMFHADRFQVCTLIPVDTQNPIQTLPVLLFRVHDPALGATGGISIHSIVPETLGFSSFLFSFAWAVVHFVMYSSSLLTPFNFPCCPVWK